MKAIDLIKQWKSYTFNSALDYSLRLTKFCVDFTCNSNNIEGSNLDYHTTHEVFNNAPITRSGVSPRDMFEVQNTKFAFNYLYDKLAAKEPVSVSMIKHLHKIVTYGTYDEDRWNKGERPGQFKKGDYVIGVSDEGCFPDEVDDAMTELVDEVNDAVDGFDLSAIPADKALRIVTYFHLRFEQIHPFADGNGRTGRLLLCYMLMLFGLPPVIIYSEDRETYYMALEVFDKSGEISGMIKFIMEQMEKTWSVKKPKYTLTQIEKARELAPDVYKNLSDDELWALVGNYLEE